MEVQVTSGTEDFIHTNLFREISLNASPGDKFSRSIELSLHDTLVDKYVGCPSVSQDSSTS
jgi:hypothetical protein